MNRADKDMMNKRAAEDLLRIRELLNAWDPCHLIEMGAPEDEFDSEAAAIYRSLGRGRVHSEEQLARLIASVFRSQFSDRGFTVGSCGDIAQRIWSWWVGRTACPGSTGGGAT